MEKFRGFAGQVGDASGEEERWNRIVCRTALAMLEVAQEVRRTTEDPSVGFGRMREGAHGVRGAGVSSASAARDEPGVRLRDGRLKMVAGCPKCGARYRVDADRIGRDGAKLRCTQCSAVFLVRAPKETVPVEVASPEPAPVEAAAPRPPTRVSAETAGTAEAPSSPEPVAHADRDRLVLIADPDDARGKASAEAVERWGLQPHRVQDGVEAMLAIQRLLPRAVVLDAALPKMFGFQVCEVVKRNESLRDTFVVLVGAIHPPSRYRRDPADLYGADVYIEQPDLPDGLQAVLRGAGLPMGGDASSWMPQPTEPLSETAAASSPEAPSTPGAETPPGPELSLETPAPGPVPDFATEPPSSPEPGVAERPPAPPADEDPETTEERERALRLARIAVSEMLLYQPEKFEQAILDGDLEQVLDFEIQEARALLRQRIREDVREETDFIVDELNRVAAERG
ncbi:MAG: zinc-ribbon domain-containing protein [Myxococcota bacterium]